MNKTKLFAFDRFLSISARLHHRAGHITRTAKKFFSSTSASLAAIGLSSVFVLSSCGGGGGGSSQRIIAPESLDGVVVNFFGAFEMSCSRLSGAAGNETGSVKYTRNRTPFRYAANSIGTNIELPAGLFNVSYNYVRTGPDTGQITFRYTNGQAFPYPRATNAQTEITDGGSSEMFWGTYVRPTPVNTTEITVNILFTETNGSVVSNSTRIDSAYVFNTYFIKGTAAVAATATQPAVPATPDRTLNVSTAFQINSPDVTYRLNTGASLPVGYTIYNNLTDSTPASAVPTTLQDRTINFTELSSRLQRKFTFQETGTLGPAIPNVPSPEKSGTILVQDSNVIGAGGTFSYHRTGGDKASLAIQYNTLVNGISTPVNLVYTLTFNSENDGGYVDSLGSSGLFVEDLYRVVSQ